MKSEILHNIKKIRMSGPETSKNKHFNSSVQQTDFTFALLVLRVPHTLSIICVAEAAVTG